MSQPTVRILIGATWIASVAAAYFIGQSGTTPAPSSGAAGTSQAAHGSGAAAHFSETKSGTVVGNFQDTRPEDPNAPAKRNVQDLIMRARLEMGTGMNGFMNMRGMFRAIAPLVELDDSQLQEALAEVESTVKDPQQRMMFFSILLGQWAEKDGPAALAYAEEKVKGKGPFDAGAKMSVIGAWSRQDPEGVWKWFQKQKEKNPYDPSAQMTIHSVFAGLASRDLDMAFTRLNTLDEQERSMALMGIVNSTRDGDARDRLLRRSESLTPELRKQLQSSVVGNWAMTDVEGAIKWVRSQPTEDQAGLRTSVGSTLMMSDPERGAQFQLEGAAEKDRSSVYGNIVSNWAWRDPKGAGEWLTKQPQGPELDNARQNFASAVSQRDPAAAFDWAKSVTDDERRANSVQQVYNNWKKKDEAAANAALDNSGLPAERIEKIRGVVDPVKVK